MLADGLVPPLANHTPTCQVTMCKEGSGPFSEDSEVTVDEVNEVQGTHGVSPRPISTCRRPIGTANCPGIQRTTATGTPNSLEPSFDHSHAFLSLSFYYWVKVVTYAAVIFLCRKPCAVGKSMIYMSFLLDESIVCGIDFSNTLQGHTCF